MIQKQNFSTQLKRFLSLDMGSVFSSISPTTLRKRFRTGSLISRILRPVFEKPRLRAIVGAQLFAGVALFGPLGLSINSHPEGLAYPDLGSSQVVLEVPVTATVATESTRFQNPTADFVGVSTRFRAGHAGYDLRAPLGSDVYPIESGVVTKVVHSTTGYGRRVIISHGEDYESLYAHMGLISVVEGEKVLTNTKIGEVGLTGLTTGPHIHLEIYRAGVPVNPGVVLDLDNLPN